MKTFKDLLQKFVGHFDDDKSFVCATVMDYFAAHAPPMAQWWRSTYIDGKNIPPTSPEHLDIEVRWRWAYAKKMVQLRPNQKDNQTITIEKVKFEFDEK